MPDKVLRVKNINYKNILSNITFDWHQGEIIALMGANGSGKSTLAKLLNGLSEPASGTIELLRDGVICLWDQVLRWQEIGYVGQHPRRQTIGASLAEELGFGLLNLGEDPGTVRKKVEELAWSIGLGGKENQSPSTLSGGERQRLVTAAILALNPAFLILDEALTMLDQRSQTQVFSLLLQVRGQTGQLWITHDPDLAMHADRLLLIKNGEIYDAGRPEVLADINLRREYGIRTDWETWETNQTGTRTEPNSGLIKIPFSKMESVHERTKLTWEGTKQTWEGTKTAQDGGLQHNEEQDSGCLVWDKAIYGSRLKINNTVKHGEFIGIVGPSGAGKSTLLESVIGLNMPGDGTYRAFGDVVKKANLGRLRERCRLLLQEPGEYFLGRTVYEEIFYREPKKISGEKKENNLAYLATYGIGADLAERMPERLSGGEKQRVALAAAMVTFPEVLLLDEPMLGLDGPGKEQMHNLFASLKGQITVLMVTHDLAEVLDFADRLWLVEEGELVLDCLPNDWHRHLERLQKAGVRCPGVNPFAWGGENNERGLGLLARG